MRCLVRAYSSLPAFWGRSSVTGSPITCRIAKASMEIPTMTTARWTIWRHAYRFRVRMRPARGGGQPGGALPCSIPHSPGGHPPAARRPGPVGRRRLLLPQGHQEHPIDLVGGGLVLDAVRDAPHPAQPPLVEVGRVVEHELLGLDVDLGALLGVEGGATLADQIVERGVAVVAVVLAALEHVVQDRVRVEDRIVAPGPVEHRAGLAVLDP